MDRREPSPIAGARWGDQLRMARAKVGHRVERGCSQSADGRVRCPEFRRFECTSPGHGMPGEPVDAWLGMYPNACRKPAIDHSHARAQSARLLAAEQPVLACR